VPGCHATPAHAGDPETRAMRKTMTEAAAKAVSEAMVEMVKALHYDD
jgi:hypothetical protein